MRKRWTAAGMLEAEQQFGGIIGYQDLAKLVPAIERATSPTDPLRNEVAELRAPSELCTRARAGNSGAARQPTRGGGGRSPAGAREANSAGAGQRSQRWHRRRPTGACVRGGGQVSIRSLRGPLKECVRLFAVLGLVDQEMGELECGLLYMSRPRDSVKDSPPLSGGKVILVIRKMPIGQNKSSVSPRRCVGTCYRTLKCLLCLRSASQVI